MDPHEKKLLRLLNAINQKDAVSQRDLSQALNVSLGSVNASIRRLEESGLIRKKNADFRRMNYHLTKAGLLEKKRLTFLYWRKSLDRYSQIRNNIEDILCSYQNKNVSKIAFYGASRAAEIAYIALMKNSFQLTGIIDDEKMGQWFLNLRIISPVDIHSISFDKLLVTDLNIDERRRIFHTSLKKYRNDTVFIEY
jgi:DNA-binding MarR family transcriptional regulator